MKLARELRRATNPKTSMTASCWMWCEPSAAASRVVSRDYDVPYIAGYSIDGRTVFIDRHLPRSFRWLTKTVRVDPFLLTHEIVEKALLDELRLHYLHAHHVAPSRPPESRGGSISAS